MRVGNERSKVAVRLLTAFVIGFVSLTLEIAYTRVISFKLFYYYTYFAIGLALLGLGASSAVVSLSTRVRSLDPIRLVQLVAPAAAVVGLAGYATVARIPTDTNLIWAGSAGQAAGQVARLAVLSVSLTAVFFAVGLLMASLFVAEAGNVRRLYFWDLTGAALGCLVAVPLQASIGPPAMILASIVALAGLGVVAAAMTRVRFGVSVAILVAVVIGSFGADQLKVRTDQTKTLRDRDEIAGGDWGPVFRVDAVQGFGDLFILHHDGLWGSAIWRYDGTPATTDKFLTNNRQIPFAAAGGEAPRVLIIGAAGGHEVQASLFYGAGQIDAVELNPVTVSLLRGEFADYSGNLTSRPNVNYVEGDGRTFLARSGDEYDLIWFVAPDSYAAANAATSGAFVLSESYLYTEEMIESAYDHLSPDGVIVAQFGDRNFAERPMRTARYFVTAREALGDRIDDFAAHAALVYERGQTQFETISTIMLFRSPVDERIAARIQDSVAKVPTASTLYLPGVAREAGVVTDLITLPHAEVDRIVADYPLDISAIDDDRPFFWHFTGFGSVLTDWQRSFEDAEIAIGERLIVVLVALAAVIAAVLLWLPFAVRRSGRASFPGRLRLFVYFAALGLGFMFIEISMIQRFALLLGYPTLSLSVSLFTLLIATAVGARLSEIVRAIRSRALPAATGLLIVLAALYLAISDPLTETALAWPQWARIAIVIGLLLPIGLLLGLFLPSGMDAVVEAAEAGERDRGRVVAWCWAVNAFFSVLGASLTTIVSMTWGFDRAVLAGLVLYVVAAAALGTWRLPSETQVELTTAEADLPRERLPQMPTGVSPRS
jgi:Spermine/spermidine synthase domain